MDIIGLYTLHIHLVANLANVHFTTGTIGTILFDSSSNGFYGITKGCSIVLMVLFTSSLFTCKALNEAVLFI